MKRVLAVLRGLLVCLILFNALPDYSQASFYFNPHFIISDQDFTDAGSLTLGGVEQFLERHGSGLAGRVFPDADGRPKQASTIIWQAAQLYQISPKVLLTTLQKEQSLITNGNPSINQLNKAMGYACPDSGGCSAGAATFGKQVDGAAWQFRQYLDNPNRWNIKVGGTYEVDNSLVTPATQATAALYNYTPHIAGNESFHRLWLKYWGKNFPDGSLVKANDSPGVWLIQYGVKRLITSWGVLLSRFDPNKIITVGQSDLDAYESGPAIKFHNFSLLQAPDGSIYLLDGNEIRKVDSAETFRFIGFNPEEIITIEESDLIGYTTGLPITINSIHPTGALLQDNKTGGVFFVKDGNKYPIVAREIMDARYPNRRLTQVSQEQLEQFATGDPVTFGDGDLVRASDDNKVYVISSGQRHWISTEEAFAKYRYRWDNIIVTSLAAIEIHPLAESIE